jgi:hypothetical protein
VSCPRALARYRTIARFLNRKEVAGVLTKASRVGFACAAARRFGGSTPSIALACVFA